jgi:hypothetical protein
VLLEAVLVAHLLSVTQQHGAICTAATAAAAAAATAVTTPHRQVAADLTPVVCTHLTTNDACAWAPICAS